MLNYQIKQFLLCVYQLNRQLLELFSKGILQEDTAESNVVTPEPVILIFEIEQRLVVGKSIAVPF